MTASPHGGVRAAAAARGGAVVASPTPQPSSRAARVRRRPARERPAAPEGVPTLRLRPGRERSVEHGHPWIFDGAVDERPADLDPGQTVALVDADGGFLAMAACNPASRILARVWSWQPETLDAAWFARAIARAIARRDPHRLAAPDGALRLVHAESDGLPGLVCDRYGDTLVLQFNSAGVQRHRRVLLDTLLAATAPMGVRHAFERSDEDMRRLEGLPASAGPLAGEPAPQVVVDEAGLRFEVPIASGQKTGFYLDQRESRARVRAQATGARVLDVFCYTGGFTLAALAGGARQVTAIDASAAAIERLLAQAGAQGVEPGRLDARVADAFVALRELRNRGERFDLIVLDPPKFAPTLATVPAAARAYKDVNLLALKLLAPGGRLFTYSCSGAVTADLFQKIVAGAAADAGVAVRLLARLGPAEDHPVLLSFPEGDYLKGLACGID